MDLSLVSGKKTSQGSLTLAPLSWSQEDGSPHSRRHFPGHVVSVSAALETILVPWGVMNTIFLAQ